MAFVLDASVTCAWLFDDEATAATDELQLAAVTEGAYVPTLWQTEVCNVLVQAHRRSRIKAHDVTASLGRLARMGMIRVPQEPSPVTVADAAMKHGLSAYGALYLVCARDLGVPLATLDRELREAAAVEHIVVLPAAESG